MLTDAEDYSEHQNLQTHDTKIFLESVIRKMDWSREEQDVVMDIGCGPGNSCRKIFLPAFPRMRKLIGVDVLEDRIELAKRNNAHEKIEYHVADIEDKNTITKWSQQISKVISIYCFHWLGNQIAAFQNIHHLLKPQGEASLLFVLNSALWDSYELLYSNPKWSKYLENKNSHVPESHFKKYDATFYRNLLQDIGFRVIMSEEELLAYPYPTDDDCKESINVLSLGGYIPDELKSEFKDDLFRGFLQYNPRREDGRPVLYYTVLKLLVRKQKV